MSRRYPIILGAMSLVLAGLAVTLVLVVREAWVRLSFASATVDPEQIEQFQREIDALNRFVQFGYPVVGSLVLAAAIPAIAAIVLLALRQTQRASASATASRDAS